MKKRFAVLVTMMVLLLGAGSGHSGMTKDSEKKGGHQHGEGMCGAMMSGHRMGMGMMGQGMMGREDSERMGGRRQVVVHKAFDEIASSLEHAGALKISEEQVAGLRKIREELEIDLIKNRAALQIATLKLKNLLEEDTLEQKLAEEQVLAEMNATKALQLAALDALVNARAALSKEQQEAKKELLRGKGETEGEEAAPPDENAPSSPEHEEHHT